MNRQDSDNTSDPRAVRQRILQAAADIQTDSSAYIPASAIAERLGLGIEELEGHIEILHQDGKILTDYNSSGCFVHLTAGQRQRFRESILSVDQGQIPEAVRSQVIAVILDMQRNAPSEVVSPKVVSDRLSLNVDEVEGHLEILADDKRINFSRVIGASMTAGQMQRFEESQRNCFTGDPIDDTYEQLASKLLNVEGFPLLLPPHSSKNIRGLSDEDEQHLCAKVCELAPGLTESRWRELTEEERLGWMKVACGRLETNHIIRESRSKALSQQDSAPSEKEPNPSFRPHLPRVFISHATQDRELVEREIVQVLRDHGIDTWYAVKDVPTAADWERTIRAGLESCDWFLVVVTPRSVASEWVRSEVHWAIDNRWGRIVVVVAEDCDWRSLHLRIAQIQYLSFAIGSRQFRKRLLNVWNASSRAGEAADAPAAQATTPRISEEAKQGTESRDAMPSEPRPSENEPYTPALWEKILVFSIAVIVVLFILILSLREKPFPDPNIVVMLRTILSLAVSVLGAVVPGFLHVGWKKGGFALRAGGALALFVLTFFGTPKVLPATMPSDPNSPAATPSAQLDDDANQRVLAATELLKSDDEAVQRSAVLTLKGMGSKAQPVIPALTERLAGNNRKDRAASAWAMAIIKPDMKKTAVPILIELLQHYDPSVKAVAIEALVYIGRESVPALAELLDHSHNFTERQEHICNILRRIGPPAAVSPLISLLNEKTWVRRSAVEALGSFGPAAATAVAAVTELLRDEDDDLRGKAAIALADIGPAATSAIPAITELLRDKNENVRRLAIVSLAGFGPAAKSAVPAITKLLKDTDENVRKAAVAAVEKFNAEKN
jgi:HEAT repeat protein